MVGVAWFYSKVKGVLEKTPFFIIKTTPTITLSAVIRFYFGLTGVKPATPHKIRIPARASRVFPAHNADSKPKYFSCGAPARRVSILWRVLELHAILWHGDAHSANRRFVSEIRLGL